MASSLKNGFSLSGSLLSSRAKGSSGDSLPFVAVQVADSRSKEFLGKPLNISDQIGFSSCNVRPLCVNVCKDCLFFFGWGFK